MRSALTGETLFATVLLTRQATSELILVVEGDDDHFLFEAHINEHDVRLVRGTGGKSNVLHAAALAEQQRLRGVRFFVDSDFDALASPPVRYPENVTSSSNHDVLMDVLLAGQVLLHRVIDTHSRAARMAGTTFSTSDVREQAFALAAAMVPLRIANETEQWELRLRDFPLGNVSSLPVSETELAAIAIGRSSTALAVETITSGTARIADRLPQQHDQFVGDHDFFSALSRVLRDHGVTAGARSLLTAFLAGLLCAHLGATDWYRDLVGWGETHGRMTFSCPCAA
ncbi:hypothetical protein ACI3KY_14585 [Microbacterium sp. ZW T2_14]|uniref:hypothetical protein n=1 Tax=Microbacterium sp. ZW T2_14 TaxID=3378079 RepID=UPI003853BEA1